MKKNIKTTDELYNEIVKETKDWIMRHKDDEFVMKNAKEHLDYLVQSLFSYCPKKISNFAVKISFDKNFRKLVGLD